MSEHVHFSIDELRAAHTATTAKLRAHIAALQPDTVDRQYHELSLQFATAMFEATVAAFEARNAGVQEYVIAKALGTALGNHTGNYLANAASNDMLSAGMALQDSMDEMITAHLSDDRYSRLISAGTVVRPLQGSRA